MIIKKSLILILILLLPLTALANSPCSGNKGGISHCEGVKFICNDGSVSGSAKNCAEVFGGNDMGYSSQPPVNAESKTDITNLTNQNYQVSSSGTESVERDPKNSNVLRINYPGFTVWLDCSKRGAIKFQYNAQHDTGNLKRYDSFFIDPNVPSECQQFSAKPYGQQYDRGHQVPANHLDYSAEAIKATNFMPNILPQAANMNRGAWLGTEEITECYRDTDELLIIGGVIWGDNPADDYFVQSHGVKTPDAYWKVIIRGTGQDERAIAWIVPNSQEATKKNLDKYLVTVDEIEKITGEKIPVADYAKHDKPNQSWIIPQGCNKG